MKKRFIMIMAVVCGMQVMAMEQAPQAPEAPGNVPTTITTPTTFGPRRYEYEGEVISAASITKLAPPAPQELHESITKFFVDDKDKLESYLLGYSPMVGSVKQSHDGANKLLTNMGKPNKSDWNYVFEAVSGYMMYIAGHVNRQENLTVTATDHFQKAHPYELLADGTRGRWLTGDDYKTFSEKLAQEECDTLPDGRVYKMAPKTYQTISRMAHWLLFKQAQKDGKIPATITVPDTYLMHIPGRSEEVSDRNYVVVSKKLDGLQEVVVLTPEEADAVKAAITAVGLFGCNKGGLKRMADGTLVLLDLEQPNNTTPRQFFHKADWKVKQNVQAGLEDFVKHFTPAVKIGQVAKTIEVALSGFEKTVQSNVSIATLVAQYSAE